ncbi:MAG: ABC transporter ATP-binding protein [Chloroflexi bacterium]|nr:MAG: ABC transporter ATP-binding protein [Chloroflexota bacterium]
MAAIIDRAAPSEAGAQPKSATLTSVIETSGLTKHFRVGGLFAPRFLHAADDIDLSIAQRQIVALVGESGSGKSTVARLLALIYRPTRGEVRFKGRPLSSLRARRDVLDYRGRVPMVFQDPYSSLNPVYRVSHGIMRALKLHRPDLRPGDRRAEAERVLESVGLTPPGRFLAKYPHELSGGQRQRIGFAQALASSPELILADEPVSMLDVSVRIGVLNLMAQLRAERGISILYITHDIASARYVADRLLVMYAGHVVESGPSEDVLAHPKHPYTQLLLSAVPDPRAPVSSMPSADVGEPPRVVDPGEGCRFRGRCPYAIELCSQVTPRLRELRPDHTAACHVATADQAG